MQQEFIKRLIESVYADKENILFEKLRLKELSEANIFDLDGFHLTELYLLETNDDYFCGIRANHFCVEYGWSETFQNEDQCDLILITANHKGIRTMTLLKLQPKK